MEENNYNVDLAEISEDFNNKTLRYRINAFAYACNMEDIDNKNFKVSKHINALGTSIILGGEYQDLHFNFTNYYKKEKLDKKIIDIPFGLSLTKKVNQDLYGLNIDTDNGKKTQFTIYRYCSMNNPDKETICDDVRFVTNIVDFSQVLKLIKAFVSNPKLVFDTYNEINYKFERFYKQDDFEKGIIDDEKLDKPTGKLKNLVKKVKNS